MQSFLVVGMKVTGKTGLQLWDGGIVFDVDVFVLDAAPKTLDEDIVERPTTTIHADLDVGFLETVGEGAGLIGGRARGTTRQKARMGVPSESDFTY